MPVYTAVSEVADDMQVTQHEVDYPQTQFVITSHLQGSTLYSNSRMLKLLIYKI